MLYRQAFALELADASPHPQIEAAFAQAGSTLEKTADAADAVADRGKARAGRTAVGGAFGAQTTARARSGRGIGGSTGFNSLDGD